MDEMVYLTILLYLSDKVLRLVDEATTTGELWKKLESLYLTKSLPNNLYLKEKFFGYKIDQSKDLEENLDEFQKIVVDLNNIGQSEEQTLGKMKNPRRDAGRNAGDEKKMKLQSERRRKLRDENEEPLEVEIMKAARI
ncbi:Cc-nbs-lrr resistance protein [Cucumis melo var. makuwa]|uniref:Cc-nbs-lrr resistance protein n=1 Tax=Cucumis melo var. makuwa TaxID=1194695 RepID=A0A5A7SWU9_CUCMM|nr:Cc-nbs-lrr resistance protein [Cucumis melo var. makuwa]